jgi:hypothetical protein
MRGLIRAYPRPRHEFLKLICCCHVAYLNPTLSFQTAEPQRQRSHNSRNKSTYATSSLFYRAIELINNVEPWSPVSSGFVLVDIGCFSPVVRLQPRAALQCVQHENALIMRERHMLPSKEKTPIGNAKPFAQHHNCMTPALYLTLLCSQFDWD